MKVERIKELQSLIVKLQDFGVECEEDYESLLENLNNSEITEEDLEMSTSNLKSITVNFPDEFDLIDYSVDDFCEYMKEAVESFEEVDNSTVRTNHIRQTIIDSEYRGWYLFEDKVQSYTFEGEGYKANVISNPFLIGLFNSKKGNFDDDYGVYPCSCYLAIELKYDEAPTMSVDEEDKLIEKILYYLTQKLGVSIYRSEFLDVHNVIEDLDEEKFEVKEEHINVGSLVSYTSLTRMYMQATSARDNEIRYLYYYKIIEHISPIVAKLNAYDKLNKRLDLLSQSERDYKYLESIFSISRKYDTDIKDDFLCASVILECVDVIPLMEMLPDRLQKLYKHNLGLNNKEWCDENLSEEQITSCHKQLASSLYSTRNSIVHAKSNFQSTGNEFHADEMEAANRIMDIIASSIIQWNERQAEVYRLKE